MDIDLVYTWVNSADEDLMTLREKYSGRKVSEYSTGKVRYQDNGELRHSLRSAEKNLPFIRKIFVFYSGKIPDWVKEKSEKITFICQDDVLPEKVTPCFHSGLIESYIYKIPGLSEHYIYANDDVFFCKLHSVEDFFDERSRPKVGAVFRCLADGRSFDGGGYKKSEIKGLWAMRKHLHKFPPLFWPSSMMGCIKRIFWGGYLMAKRLPHRNSLAHVAQPYLKSHWEDFHALFAEEMKRLSKWRFRSDDSLPINTMYLYFLYSIDKAVFYLKHDYIYMEASVPKRAREAFYNSVMDSSLKTSQLCLNDSSAPNREEWLFATKEIMKKLFSVKASWE